MKLLPSRLALALASTLFAAPLFAAEPVVTVNGTAIPQEQADIIQQMHIARGAPEGDELKAQVRNDLIDLRLIADAATKAGLDKKPEIAARIEVQRELNLMQAYFEDYFSKNAVTDQMINEEYAKVQERFKDVNEYKSRHILVADEAAAKAIIDKFRAAPTLETFSELAKESTDPGSKDNGGDLGWSDGNNFVKPFGDALKALEKGKFTETPVKSDFGYHVIWLEDTRPVQVPPLEQLKPQLTQGVQDRMRLEEVARLRADAKVE